MDMEDNDSQKVIATKLLQQSIHKQYYSERKMNALSIYDSS